MLARALGRGARLCAPTVATLVLLGCGEPAPTEQPPRRAEPRTLRAELADEIAPLLAREPTARGRAAAIARVVFGERRLQEKVSCLELAALLARAAGTRVARTPHHAVIGVEGEGGPVFLDPADPGAAELETWLENLREEFPPSTPLDEE